MTKLYLAAFLLTTQCVCAQNPLIYQWDKRFGGTDEDYLPSLQQTTDGGFILGGSSDSGASGNKTQPSWGGSDDYWIVKTDFLGNMEWDKRFGGTSDDVLFSLQQTADGGFILGGYSYSGISGDKTQPSWGNTDYWIVKTDASGNYQWDKRFGGSAHDYLRSLQQTADGGFILGGYSYSGIGGDKTQPSWGDSDYWIVKTDSLGNKLWDKRFGGTGEDDLLSLWQTSDGGYILGGSSESGVSGDKTQPCWGGSGDYDYWIVKTDSLGNKLWDKRYGGTNGDHLYSLRETSDRGFILGGYSLSGISGNKTEPSWGSNDYWIVKTDSAGTIQWDKRYGGTGDERDFGNISQTFDQGYLVAGTSYSSISGDKTEANLGLEQTWVVKTDSTGLKVWDITVFTTGHDEIGFAIQTEDGCYAMANFTSAHVGGYKTQGSWNNSDDYWISKFCDSSCLASVPIPNLTAVPTTTCEKSCVDFADQTSNCPTSWHWLFPGGSPSSFAGPNPPDVCYNTVGTYDVTLITSNSFGADTLFLPNFITVNPAPPPPVITQVNDTLISSPALSYQWSKNGTTIPGATNQKLHIVQSANYSVTIFGANGCPASDTAFFIVLPTADFQSADTTICTYNCISFSDLSLNTPGSWQWYFEGGSPPSSFAQNPGSICYDAPGSFDVTLIATNAMGSDTLILSDYMTVYPLPSLPVITQNIDTLMCSPANGYQWYFNGNPIAGATNQQYIATQPGDYSVTVTDSIGCSSFNDTSVILPMPQSSFYSDATTGCPGTCFDFTNNSINAGSYQWLFPGGNPGSSTAQNPSGICYVNPGTYDVSLVASSSFASDTLLLSGYITIFTPLTVSISQNANSLTCNTVANSYQWFLGGNIIPGATNQTLAVSQPGDYTVEVTDSNGCISSAIYNVSFIAAPLFSATDTLLCEKFCIDFLDQSTNNPITWEWYFPGGIPASSSDQNPSNICYDDPGSFEVMLITTNISGTDTLLLQDYITVFPTPPFPVIMQNGYTLTSSPAVSYLWQFNSVDIAGATNQSYTITQTGFYTVVVGDSNGCVNSASLFAEVTGVDDLLFNQNISIYPNPSNGNFMVEWLNGSVTGSINIEIINTLGQVVFSSEEYIHFATSEWKKEIDASEIVPGIYFISIHSNDVLLKKKIIITK